MTGLALATSDHAVHQSDETGTDRWSAAQTYCSQPDYHKTDGEEVININFLVFS